ncbi:MAG: hypothetical protein ABSE73_05710 [Planctomycetota bacterium]
MAARFGQWGLAAVFFLAALPGCEKDVPYTDYMPLRDGNRWEYRLLDLPLLKRLEAGQAIATAALDADLAARGPGSDSDLAPKSEVVATEKQDENASGAPRPASASARRVVLELREAINELTYRALYDTAEQVWSKRNGYIGFQSSRGRSYLLILPPHTRYRWIVTAPTGQDLYYEVETAAATVGTPAGTFDACALARQESHDRREIFRYWFAPNVGLVRRSKYFLNEEVFRQELVEYSVKPATPATRAAEDREVRKALGGLRRGTEFQERRRDGGGRLESAAPSAPERDGEEKR